MLTLSLNSEKQDRLGEREKSTCNIVPRFKSKMTRGDMGLFKSLCFFQWHRLYNYIELAGVDCKLACVVVELVRASGCCRKLSEEFTVMGVDFVKVLSIKLCLHVLKVN